MLTLHSETDFYELFLIYFTQGFLIAMSVPTILKTNSLGRKYRQLRCKYFSTSIMHQYRNTVSFTSKFNKNLLFCLLILFFLESHGTFLTSAKLTYFYLMCRTFHGPEAIETRTVPPPMGRHLLCITWTIQLEPNRGVIRN